MESPFSESLDGSVTSPEPGIAKLKGSDLGHLTAKDASMGKFELKLLTTSQPIEPLRSKHPTQVSNEIKELGKAAVVSEAWAALTAKEMPVKDKSLSFSTFGDVTFGFLLQYVVFIIYENEI